MAALCIRGARRPQTAAERCLRLMLTVLLAACGMPALAAAVSQPSAQHLLTEYLQNPLGIDVRVPRFSWQIVEAERGALQAAYQIQVAHDPALLGAPQATVNPGEVRPAAEIGGPDVWDSGRVDSPESLNVPYGGPPLQSQTTYYWRVRIWDQHGQASDFSPPGRFETGLLRPEEWTGRWITAGSGSDPRVADGLLLRREFQLAKPAARARVYVSGLGYYELRLNGRKVGDRVLDPGYTSYSHRVLYSTYDVTPLLRVGANAVGALLGHGWFKGASQLLVQLNIQFTDGARASVVTDGAWRVSRGPILENSIYNGETYDARLEQPGWDMPGFNDSAWGDAQEAAPPGGALAAEMIPPIRVVQSLAPVAVTHPQPGVFVFDFGQNFAGWCRLQVSGPAGTRVTLKHAELLFPNGLVNQQNLRTAKATDTYILRGGGPETYEPRFTYHGFRHVQVEGFPGTPTPASLQARVIHTDLPPRGEFSCSNPLLNQVQHNALWSYTSNFFSIPTDCPQRDERQGWMGDAHMTADMALYNFGVEPAYTKFLQDIQDSQGPDGSIPDTVPYIWGTDPGDPMWASAYLFILWDVYRHTGDRRLLDQHFDGIVRWVELLHSRAPDNILRYGNYGDWISLEPTPQELISTGAFCRCAWIVARVAEILGRDREAVEYRDLSQRIAAAFNARFLDPATGQYGNGSQLSQLWPLYLGIVPLPSHQAVLNRLVDNVMVTHHGHLSTGFIGTRYLLETLTREGRADVAYTVASQPGYPGWGYMVANGATTIWELWDLETGPGMDSHNHAALGFVSGWYYAALAGIEPDPDYPGYERFTVRPHVVGDLRQAEASVNTLRGHVASAWELSDGAVRLQAEVPANSHATISVPKAGLRDAQVSESGALAWSGGAPVAGVEGIDAARDDGDWISFDVGSGIYDFRLTGRR